MPSGLNATDFTALDCGRRALARRVGFRGSVAFPARPSGCGWPRAVRPPGAKATESTAALPHLGKQAGTIHVGRVPQLHGTLFAAGGEVRPSGLNATSSWRCAREPRPTGSRRNGEFDVSTDEGTGRRLPLARDAAASGRKSTGVDGARVAGERWQRVPADAGPPSSA
ncbi:hypothetical protein ACRAWF_16380 [Streptomyces sp. L7]